MLWIAPVWSHNLGEGYVYLQITEASMTGRVELNLSDINQVIPLGTAPGERPGEAHFEANREAVLEYLRQNLEFIHDGTRHRPVFSDHFYAHQDMASFVRINFKLPDLGVPPETIQVRYSIFFNDGLPDNRGQVLLESNTRSGIEANEAQFSAIFGPGREVQTINLDKVPWGTVFRNFVRHGVWHIWIGIDHVLFLCALLLPSVMRYRDDKWVPAETFRESFIYVVKVVTLFTVAHTITLSLAALGLVQLPVALVEGIIALSITVVAVNILRPFLDERVWIVVFVFGLFHGLGFANVLAPLGVSGPSRTAALLGFNVGVELGQLVIILAVFPLLFLLRNWSGYRSWVLLLGSVVLLLLSSYWFIERTVDVPFLSADMFKSAMLAPAGEHGRV
jgi:hypothetical protein